MPSRLGETRARPGAQPPRRRFRRLLPPVLLAPVFVHLGLAWTPGDMAREWTRAKIEAGLRRSTGLEVRIDSIILRPLPPEIELRGVGFSRAGRRVAEIPAARAWVRPLSLLRGDLHLTRLEIDSPLLEVDTDLTFPAGSEGGNGTARIDSFHLRDGRLLVRDAAGAWKISVPRLRMESARLWQGGVLTGFLEGDRIRIEIGEHRFEPLSVRGRLGFAGGRWSLAAGRLEWAGRGRVDVDGQVALSGTGDALPVYAADLDVEIAPGPLSEGLPWRLPRVGGDRLGWSGRVEGTGSDFRLRGRLRTESLVASGLTFSGIAGGVSASPGRVDLSDLSARVFDGALGGGAHLHSGPAGWVVDGEAALRGARIAALPLPSFLLSLVTPLDPRFTLTVDGTLPVSDPSRSNLAWTLGLMPPGRDVPDPFTGPRGGFRGAFREGNLFLEEGKLNVVGVDLRLHGTASLDGPIRLPVTASAIDAAATLQAIAGIWPAAEALGEWRPQGEIRLSGEVEGTRAAPRLRADLQGIALGAGGIDLGSLTARVSADRKALIVEEGILEGAAARVTFRAEGTLAGQARLQVDWILDRVDLSTLSRLAGRPEAAAGELTGAGRLEWDRSGAILEARLAGTDLAAAGLALDRAAIAGSYGPTGLVLDRLRVERGSGILEAEGSMPVSGQGGRIAIRAVEFPFDSVAGLDGLSGRLTADALLGGCLPAPFPLGPVAFRVEELAWRGAGPIAVTGSIRAEEEDLVLNIEAADGNLRGWARIPLDPEAPFRAEAEIDRLEWELDPAEGRLRGTLEAAGARLTAGGRLSRPEQAEYELEVGTLGWRSEEWTIGNLAPVLLGGSGRTVRLQPAAFGIADQEFTISGEAELADPPTYAVAVEGGVDLRLLEPFLPETRLGGIARVDIRVDGLGSEFAPSGELQLTGGYFKRFDFPLVLDAVSARASLSSDRLILSDLLGRAGNGVVTGEGEAVLRGGRLADYRLDLRGEGVDLEYPPDLNSLSDFRLTLAPRDGSPLLSGRIDLQRARYTRNLHLETALLSSSPPVVPRAAPSALLDRVGLDVRLSADDQVWIDNDLARAELWAELELVGTAARPLVLGTLESLEAGQVRFQRVKYDLTAATVQFTVSPPNDPDLNFRAETRVGSHRVFLTVSGRLSRPQIDLTSDPELPREQIVALLLTGGTWGGAKDAELSPQYAINYLAGSLEPVQKAIGRLTGVDVRIDPSSLEGQEDPTARVTVGKEFSGRLRAAYSTSLSRAAADVAEIRFRILPRLELRQAREDTGRDIFEARFVRSFRTGDGPEPKAERPAPARPTVAAVALDPIPEPPGEAEVRKALALEAGGAADPGELRLAAKRAQRVLIRAGRPLARVRCEGEPGAAAVPVRCGVVPGPELLLSVRGVAGSRLRQLREAVFEEWETARFEDDLAPSAIATAERHFHAQGRARARARAEVEAGAAGSPTLVLRVEPGPEVRVSRVELAGVRQLPERLLRGNLLSTHRVAARKPVLVPSRIEEDRERVRRLYFGSGFLEIEVPPPEVAYPQDADEAVVRIVIREGERSRIAAIEFRGIRHFPETDLAGRLPLATGAFPDAQALEGFARALQAEYDRAGFPDAAVAWWLESTEGGARVVYEVREGPRLRIGAIRIEGNSRTREEVIRRELQLREGDPFRREDLHSAQRRLRELGLFRRVFLEGENPAGVSEVRNVRVRVDEKDNLDLALGLGVDSDEGPRASFSAGNRNLGGGGGSLGAHLRFSGSDRLAQLLGGQKRFLGSRYEFLGSASAREEERDGFTVRRDALSAQIGRALGTVTKGRLRYRLQDVRLRDLTIPAENTGENEGLLASLGLSLHRDRRNDPLSARKGYFTGADLDTFAEAVGSEEEFTRLFLQHSRFHEFGDRRSVYGAALRIGAEWPFGSTPEVPLSERFFAGGVSSVRGYGLDEVGPRDPATGKPIGGAGLLILNQELRTPLLRWLDGILFLDGGNVFPRSADLDPLELKWTAGLGLGVPTPVGPFRAYFGWKLNRDPEDPETGAFHFTFGPSF